MALIDMLPPEILSHCFAHLFFYDRLAVTLVSRAWRATALASPEVWTYIYISTSMKSPESVLALCLSRTGRRHIHLSISECYHDVLDHDRFIAVLHPHVDRVRSIDWRGATESFEHPAPALESLTHIGPYGRRLTENLLGCEAGQLRRLHINTIAFPLRCPAVALVTELKIEIFPGRRADSTTDRLGDLFSLFPQLRALTLIGLKADHVPILRGTSPPSSLSVLHLQTYHSDVDLLDLHDAWSSAPLTDVELIVDSRMKAGLRFTAILSDALELVVDQCEAFFMRILVIDSRKRKRRLSIERSRSKIVAGAFEAAHGCLTHLRSLTISVDLWPVLCVRSPSVLPALKDITLVLEQMQERWSSFKAGEVVCYVWPWDHLAQLSDCVCSLGVDIVTLEMRRWSLITPPTLTDAEKLLREHIPALVQPGGARIRVRGVPREVVDGLVNADELRELRPLAVEWEVGSILPLSQWARY